MRSGRQTRHRHHHVVRAGVVASGEQHVVLRGRLPQEASTDVEGEEVLGAGQVGQGAGLFVGGVDPYRGQVDVGGVQDGGGGGGLLGQDDDLVGAHVDVVHACGGAVAGQCRVDLRLDRSELDQ